MSWPENYQCAAVISWDVDAEAMWLGKNIKNKESKMYMSMGEYSVRVGVPRVLRLLEKYGIKTTFFVPGWVAEHHPSEIGSITDAGHEVAHHGYLHERIEPRAPIKLEKRILELGIKKIEQATGKRPVGYRPALSSYTKNTFQLLKQHGFKYDSGLYSEEKPYFLKSGSDSKALVELPCNWACDDGIYFTWSPDYHYSRVPASPEAAYEVWKPEFEGVYEENGLYMLVLHPENSGRSSRLKMVERLIKFMREGKNVWITSGLEIAEHWRKTH